jgi:glutamyl-tRNA synthetase
MTVRTRFAPSPTGYMHIGGMRTALFCWLWARHNQGTFILRIDDTDAQRNLDAALDPIFRAFRWLGLQWDEGPEVGGPCGPYFQSQRQHLYRAALDTLLAAGHAYRDFDTAEQIAEDRQQAEAQKRPYLSSRRSLELAPAVRERWVAEGRPHVVRLLVPRDRKVAVDDAVRGHVEWDCGLMPDPVLMRSDGSFLYNFATVVDDAHMQITHVIRAEEHLTNTAVQVLLHEALQHPPPVFAHIPFITAPGSTKKLSKRDLDKLRQSPQLKKLFERADAVFPRLGLGNSTTLSPLMVEYYERLGYLPEAVLNTLARLGWSLDDKTEIMSLPTIIEHFTLERIVKAPAGFDPEKLQSFQAHWMGQRSLDEKVDGVLPFLKALPAFAGAADGPPAVDREYLRRVLLAIGDRLKVFSDILEFDEFFQAGDEPAYDEKAFRARFLDAPEADGLLAVLRDELAAAEPFEASHLESLVHDFAARQGLKMGQIVHPLRLAVTGKSTGVGLFEALALFGRERCLRRIDHARQQIARARTGAS